MLCTLLCLFNSLFVSRSTCLNAYIFSRIQKSRWHTAVHQSQSLDMVIKSPSSLRAPSYQNTDIHTRAPCYTHSKTTQTKSHFDKSHQPKHWLYSPRSLSLLQMHSNSFFFPFSLALTCPVVSRLCVRPIVARTTVGASASKKRRRSRMENMSRIRKQQKILHMSALTAAEKTVCLDE